MTSGSLLLLALASALAGIGLVQFPSPGARRGALAAFWIASGALAWALTASPWAGLAALVLWFLFPLSEMVLVLRRLRIPARRLLREAALPPEGFPGLAPLTEEMEALGFRAADDCRLDPSGPEGQEQFFRLFRDAEGIHHALIGVISEGEAGFSFAAFSSQGRDGRDWLTWNYPLSYGLKVPPQMVVHRALRCDGLDDLLEEHRELLRLNGVEEAALAPDAGADAQGATAARARLERNLARQLQYNLGIGILAPAPSPGGEDGLRYSWRGALAIASAAVRDLVRM